MKKTILFLIVAACVALLSGCTSTDGAYSGSNINPSGYATGTMAEVQPDRMLVWKAYLSIQVWSVSNAVAEATTLVENQGGFIERRSDNEDQSASITLRIPAKTFKTAVTGLETLGTVTYRNIDGKDVTEQYIDVEARLKNKIVLRDRLQQLLEKAVDVKDVLSIEAELNRVQGDIDSMEGRIKALKGQVDYATISLSLTRKPILGPLGYLFEGLFWGVEKLFIIRK